MPQMLHLAQPVYPRFNPPTIVLFISNLAIPDKYMKQKEFAHYN